MGWKSSWAAPWALAIGLAGIPGGLPAQPSPGEGAAFRFVDIAAEAGLSRTI